MGVLINELSTLLPYAAIGFGFLWNWVYRNFADTAIQVVLPSSSYQKLQAIRKDDKVLDDMCRVNSTALIHACVTVPLAFLCATSDPSIWADPFNGKSPVFELLTWVMSGYFIWDTIICVQNLKQYGITFLLHAVISFIGIYGQAAAKRSRVPYFAALFMLTELSTPFLHIRWFLTKAKETKTTYFKIINWVFVGSFTLYRLIIVEILAFIPFFKAMYFGEIKNAMSSARKFETTLVCVLWLMLNYYWGALLLKSQLRHLLPKKKVVAPVGAEPASAPVEEKKDM